METRCPDEDLLARYRARTLPDALRDALESHLGGCPACLDLVCQDVLASVADRPDLSFSSGAIASVAEVVREQVARDGSRRLRPSSIARRRLRVSAAAAALVAVVGSSLGFQSWGRSRVPALAGVERALPGPLPAGGGGLLLLPDGSRLKVEPGASASLEKPGPGERVLVRVEKGELEVWAEKAPGAFRISTPAGDVRVLGTQFRVRSFVIAGDSALAAEVYEGLVEVRTSAGTLPVRRGQRGLAIGSQGVYCQELGRPWGVAWDDMVGLLRLDGAGLRLPPERLPEARLVAATLWGGNWGEGWDWRTALAGHGSPERAAAASLLVGLGAPSGGDVWLRDRLDQERDPRVKAALEQALAWVDAGTAR